MADFKLDDFLPYQAAVLAGRLSRGLAQTYEARFGLSVAEWRVMAHLHAAGRCSVREIHHQADLEKSRVSRAVSRLQERGFVARSVAEGDRRLVDLVLTPQGEATVAEILPLAAAFEDRVFGQMKDAGAFRAALQDALEALDAVEAAPEAVPDQD